jgi:hypothetical protein
MLSSKICLILGIILQAYSCETWQQLEFRLNGLREKSRVKSSGRTINFSLWTGMFWDSISSFAVETIMSPSLGRHCLVCVNRAYHEKVRMAVG